MSNNESEFRQKKIKHVFHYTKQFKFLKAIINNGFVPSYCFEKISDSNYLIPMVSFCNIPISHVSNYMRYGKYGIGMSMDWAMNNAISPVIYLHKNTPFKKFVDSLHKFNVKQLVRMMMNNSMSEIHNIKHPHLGWPVNQDDFDMINEINIKLIQFFKNWKTEYKGNQIITYQEREWRYVPDVEKNSIISENEDEFEIFQNKDLKPKPHFPQHCLVIDSINDIRYIIVRQESQRIKILDVLHRKFGKENVIEAVVSGSFNILTEEAIHDDF